MQKLTPNDAQTQSPDLTADNIAKLRALFPELLTEGKDGMAVNVDVLKQLVGDNTVTDADEKYGLNWHGKRRARQLALTPSTGTLRPCPEDSVDWDTTQNLMIEGDNLEVLKLLQKSYAGKVKLIYIDPPYNTGKDFVYPDNFQDNIKNYLELTGQTGEDGKKLSSNTEASGRFHTDWLNMMYPRLKLARNLLREDGAIFISVDDGEIANLRAVMDDIFGAENFVAQFVWKARQFTDARAATNVSTDHEYILAYARDSGLALRGVGRDETKFTNPDEDSRGPWMSRSLLGLATRGQRPNLHYEIVESISGRKFPPNPATGWRYSPEKMQRLIDEKSILFPAKEDGRPREKKFRKDMMADFIAYRSIIDNVHTANGTEEIRSLFGADVFDFPKPTELLRQLVEQIVDPSDITLDFFAGSGTTAHSVWLQNKSAVELRRWILIQLPEPLNPTNKDQKNAADFCDKLGKPRTIAELTKERLRRAGKMVREEWEAKNSSREGAKARKGVALDEKPQSQSLIQPDFLSDFAASRETKAADNTTTLSPPDTGFRVFKLDSTNIREWDPQRDNLAASLVDAIEHVKTDRSEQDILFELLLKLGLDLCVPIETKQVKGAAKLMHDVHSIGGGVLLVCLSTTIPQADVEPLAMGMVAWHKALAPAGNTTVIFRDSAFADDVAKTNITAILNQHGIETVRSL
jgi:adenine-specific DNA-methyltransferase